ncbi:putative amp dependent CoA ligase, partial [Aspergillus costaricaensis CBS 115574]
YNPDDVDVSKAVHTDTFSNEALTYGGLCSQAARAAWGLQKRLGLQPGNTLLALVNNSNAFILLAHATWWTASDRPLNTAATHQNISHVLQIVQPTHVVTIEEKLSTVQDALASLSLADIKVLTVHCKVGNLPQFPEDITGEGYSQTLPPYDLQGKNSKDVPSTICFSSGTTGKMKGVQLSHHNLVMNSIMMRASMPVRVNSTICEVFFAPYCHVYGLTIAVLASMWVGAHYYSLAAFDLESFCRKSSEIKITDLHIVPPVALGLAASPITQKYDLASLQRIKSVQQLLKKRFPHTSICQDYGLTECSGGVIHEINEDEKAFRYVGKLFVGMEAYLIDPKINKDVSLGKKDELWLRGPVVMMGYVNNSEATKRTFSDNRWIKSGDILKLDENQNFWVTDRLKEIIKYKGFQIAPSELEDMLLHHPNVTDAAVCTVYNNAQATEVPLAYVSLSPETAELPSSEKQKVLDKIRSWMDSQLAGYKKLRGDIFHLQSLPKTPTGKILRRLLPAKLNEAQEAKL